VLGSMRETGALSSGIGEGADFVVEDGGGTEVSNRDDETGDGKRVDNGNNGTKVVEDGGAWDEDFAADAVTAAVEEGFADSNMAIEVAILDAGLLQGRLI
jgi:hypothetical protein